MSADPAGTPPRYPMPRPAGCPFDPPEELRRRSREEPVFPVSLWSGKSPWLVTRYRDVRTVLSDTRFSVHRELPGFPASSVGQVLRHRIAPTFVGMDDPEHAHHRRMLIAEFGVRRIAGLRPVVEETVTDLLDAMAARTGPVDLMESFAIPLPSMMICRILGVPYQDYAFIDKHLRIRLDIHSDADSVTRSSNEVEAYFVELIGEREHAPTDDLLGRLAHDRVRTGELTRQQAAWTAALLLVAGHATTAHMIGLGAMILLADPARTALMRDGDEAQVATAVEELLRVLTVTHTGRRRVAKVDLELGGVRIRAGEGVIGAAELANRDPAEFPDPQTVDLERVPNHHLAFGFGIHQCIGASLARLELTVAYPALLRRFPRLELAVPAADIDVVDASVVLAAPEIPVTW